MRPRRRTILLLFLLGIAAASAGWALLQRELEPPLPSLRLAVLNGCGEDGLGARSAERLRALRQEIVRVEDADRSDYERSVLIDRRGRPQPCARLARELGDLLVVQEIRADSDVDAALLLGRDWRSIPALAGVE